MSNMTSSEGLWVLGYGSLIYKPPPHYALRIPAIIFGYMRRFWQSSTDHRGTEQYPGRVVTLVSKDDIESNEKFSLDFKHYNDTLTTTGVVYYIPPNNVDEVRNYLDVREQGGYTLHTVKVELEASSDDELHPAVQTLPVNLKTGRKILVTQVYIGRVTNESFIGPEPVEETSKIIVTSVGPSGTNYDYLKHLHDSLEVLQLIHEGSVIKDEYLDTLLNQVEALKLKE